jgi:hypothetical protein
MAEVVREAAGVVAIIREFVARAMSQHVRMDRKRQLRRSTGSLDHPKKPSGCNRCPALRDEHVRARRLQRAEGLGAPVHVADARFPLRPSLGSHAADLAEDQSETIEADDICQVSLGAPIMIPVAETSWQGRRRKCQAPNPRQP